MVRILICGGRDFYDAVRAYAVLDHYHATNPFSLVIHGAAKGADNLADEWAITRFVPTDPYPAAWEDLTTPPVVTRYRRDGSAYNVLAGTNRNTRMLREGRPDVVIAFPGGTGTADMVRKARMARVPVLEIPA